jgi:hypothetical protein
MSGVADKVFERLRSGESPSIVRKSVGSGARFADGLQKYEIWVIANTERPQKENARLASTQKALTLSNQELITKNEILKRDYSRLSADVKRESDSLNKLTDKAKEVSDELGRTQTSVQ